MAEIAKFLKPGEGVLPRFIDKNLNGLVTKRNEHLIPRTWANLGISFNPAFLSAVSRLTVAGSTVLQEGDGAKFELQPVPTPGMSEILIEIDGQVLRYRNGPQPWTGFSWPNAPGTSAQGARIQTVSFGGVSTSLANYPGRLGLMRLLTQARIDGHGNDTAQIEWRLDSGDNGKVRGSARASGAESVRFNYRLVSGANPLELCKLRRIGLPEKITTAGE